MLKKQKQSSTKFNKAEWQYILLINAKLISGRNDFFYDGFLDDNIENLVGQGYHLGTYCWIYIINIHIYISTKTIIWEL